MPMLIDHIDKIAREKQRDVLFINFKKKDGKHGYFDDLEDGRDLPIRQEVIAWLECRNIAWQPCGEVANLNSMLSYMGQIYIDLPYDRSLPAYLELEAYLETPEGEMRFPEVVFWLLPLERAMKNAEHDEPGFWERWAENF